LGNDTPDGISTELVGAGLVDGRDADVIAMNLRVLIGNQTRDRPVTFALVSLIFIIIQCTILKINYYLSLRYPVVTMMKRLMRRC